jgi:hypothetical protein
MRQTGVNHGRLWQQQHHLVNSDIVEIETGKNILHNEKVL